MMIHEFLEILAKINHEPIVRDQKMHKVNRVNRADFFDYTLHEPEVRQPPSFIGIVVVFLVIVVASLFFLRAPISHAIQAHAFAVEQRIEERKQRAEYEALERKLQPRITTASSKLNELDGSIRQISAQFQSITKIPLSRIKETATRKIDRLIRQSDTFLQAWNYLENTPMPPEAVDQRRRIIADIKDCLHTNRLDPIHMDQLDELFLWIDTHNVVLQGQRDCLQTINDEIQKQESKNVVYYLERR